MIYPFGLQRKHKKILLFIETSKKSGGFLHQELKALVLFLFNIRRYSLTSLQGNLYLSYIEKVGPQKTKSRNFMYKKVKYVKSVNIFRKLGSRNHFSTF